MRESFIRERSYSAAQPRRTPLVSPNIPHGELLELFSKTSRNFAASASAENGLLMNGVLGARTPRRAIASSVYPDMNSSFRSARGTNNSSATARPLGRELAPPVPFSRERAATPRGRHRSPPPPRPRAGH